MRPWAVLLLEKETPVLSAVCFFLLRLSLHNCTHMVPENSTIIEGIMEQFLIARQILTPFPQSICYDVYDVSLWCDGLSERFFSVSRR